MAGELISALVAGMFLFSVSFKVADRSPLIATVRGLGAPPRIAGVAATGIVLVEFLLAAVLVGLGPSWAPGALLIPAATAIGAAGLLARAKRDPIPCSCFSPHSGSTLGRRQVAVGLALVLLGILLLALQPAFTLTRTLLSVIGISLVASTVHVATGWPVIAALAGFRRAIGPSYQA